MKDHIIRQSLAKIFNDYIIIARRHGTPIAKRPVYPTAKDLWSRYPLGSPAHTYYVLQNNAEDLLDGLKEDGKYSEAIQLLRQVIGKLVVVKPKPKRGKKTDGKKRAKD